MTKFLISTAIITLAVTSPASAQILGGGGLGGGLGGMGGGLGGVAGSVGSSVSTATDATRTAATAAQRAREATRQADRVARQVEKQRARDQRAGLTGSAATDVALSGTNGTLAAQGSGSAALNAPNLQTRGIVAATGRGLRRVAQTSTGVPVFVRTLALSAPVVIAPRVITPYPIYNRNVYYGGTDVVFISPADVSGYVDRQYGDLQRDLQGTGARVSRRGRDLIIDLPADVTFAFDKSDIQPRFYGTLNTLARSLNQYQATDVEVLGHTDSVGSDEYNLALSERRGRSVADFLVNRSAEPSRLVVEAMGESEPVASNASVSGRAANRRVEIVLHPREG